MKKSISITEVDAKDSALEYWKNKTAEERLDAVELLREQFYIIRGMREIPRMIRNTDSICFRSTREKI